MIDAEHYLFIGQANVASIWPATGTVVMNEHQLHCN